MAFTGPLEDRLAIRDLYGTYTDVSSRGDQQGWLDCFTEDAEWSTHLFKASGRNGLRNQWDALWANFKAVSFLGEVGMIEVVGERANARAYTHEIVRLADGKIYRLAGRYDDELLRVNGKWLFARRSHQPLVEEAPT